VPIPPIECDQEPPPPELKSGLDRIREELDVPGEHSPEAVAEAAEAAERVLGDLDRSVERGARRDARDLELVTIDPPGSRDLDQALHLERRTGGGWRVHYAIADVGAFVAMGGALDAEVTERGVTYYLPDGRAPLHPPVLGEGAASLLPGQDRPAALWRIELDGEGAVTAASVERAVVRSRRQLTYVEAQAAIDGGQAAESLALLAEVGRARQAVEAARGGVSLDLPTQRVVLADGGYQLVREHVVPAMGWNAQISLLTGIVAAEAMVAAEIGILRTIPPPDAEVARRVRLTATALGVPWPDGAGYAEVVRDLDSDDPDQAALLNLAARGLRGAGYLALHPGEPMSDRRTDLEHAAVASVYAHVTAPLRRLCDRHATEVCLALHAGEAPPADVVAALPDLPKAMASATGRESTVARAAIDLVEALLLAPLVGEVVPATVVASGDQRSTVVIARPAVQADIQGHELPLGDHVEVRIQSADPVARRVELAPA
jgi:exoribonuclease R